MPATRVPKRVIHLDCQEWRYQIGRGGLTIRHPDGKTTHVDMPTFTGMTSDDLDRGLWKGSARAITPEEVKRWILKHLREPPIPCKGFYDSNMNGWWHDCEYRYSGEIMCGDCIINGGALDPRTGKHYYRRKAKAS